MLIFIIMNRPIKNYNNIQNVVLSFSEGDTASNESSGRRIHLRFQPKYVSAKLLMKNIVDELDIFTVRCDFINDINLCSFSLYDVVNQDSNFREVSQDMTSNEYTFTFHELLDGDTQFDGGWSDGTYCALILTFID